MAMHALDADDKHASWDSCEIYMGHDMLTKQVTDVVLTMLISVHAMHTESPCAQMHELHD